MPHKRSRPGRPSISVDRVIDAAVELVDELGPADFSMRVLAQRLESSTATLYRHFAGKDAILIHVVDRVLGEAPRHVVDLPDDSTWQERLIAGAEALFRTLQQHPNVVPLFDNHVPLGPHGLAGREAAIGILLASGFPPDIAARAYTAIGHYVIGFAGQLRGGDSTDTHQDLSDFYRSLDPAHYPATVTSASFLPNSLDEEFRFGLQLLVDGLARHLS
ncbi:TetR/AcrR family transcriptional regulator [Streptomyces sp. SID13031]|uniref:TetR/AcrR family transcriptional regulator n=1 Tax=Streptomyces sp. SID13031 TaxID=2706046 RepID=UPI0013C72088|nr:TetR/AcrR family transcriptional regulator [Streptomyces sp. SID13031]NEA31104.1 TetR/AcrR family transcriptional regulator [Streptomyces sp. SID13031]